MRLGFYPNATRPVINLVFPSISLPAAGSRQGKPPQAKCYSSLLVFEVTASWAAEAAACGLWLVGLLKIWSLTFQVRMSHRHWSHNCSCEITQAHWEERTSEQTCGLESVSDNTTLCVCVCVCVRVCLSSWCFSTSAYACSDCCNHLLKHYCFLFYCLVLLTFIQTPPLAVWVYTLSSFVQGKACSVSLHCASEEFICLYSDKKYIYSVYKTHVCEQQKRDIFLFPHYKPLSHQIID